MRVNFGSRKIYRREKCSRVKIDHPSSNEGFKVIDYSEFRWRRLDSTFTWLHIAHVYFSYQVRNSHTHTQNTTYIFNKQKKNQKITVTTWSVSHFKWDHQYQKIHAMSLWETTANCQSSSEITKHIDGGDISCRWSILWKKLFGILMTWGVILKDTKVK